MALGLPPVVATLVADSQEFNASMDKSIGKMEAFGAAGDTAGARFTKFADKASTMIIGLGVALGAYGIDKAIKFQTALDQVRNTTNATAGTIDKISKSAINLSNNTTSSAIDIVGAYQAAEQAGYKWAKAQATVTASAKLAQITQQPVVDVTKALIAAQNLGLSSGMSAAKVADTLSIALKGNENGLQGVMAILQGKVGSSFAAYHQSLGESVAVANEFSQANFTNTRQIASFIGKIGEFKGPMVDLTDENGKITKSTAGWVDSLVEAGLNVDKVKEKFSGPDGLINGLNYLKQAAGGSLPQLQKYLQAIWGTSGTPAAMALIKNLGTLTTTVEKTKSASAGGLNTAFGISQKDIDNQMKELRNKAENILQGVGMFLLPDVRDVANWTDNVFKYFQSHPLVSKIASDAAISLFAASVVYKIGRGLTSFISGFAKTAQKVTGLGGSGATSSLDYLKIIADNTTKIAESTGISADEGGGSDVEGGASVAALGAGASGLSFAKAVPIFAAGALSFAATSKFLQTSFGHKVGDALTAGGLANPINDLAGTIADLTAKIGGPGTTGPVTPMLNERNREILARHHKKGKTTINIKASVKLH